MSYKEYASKDYVQDEIASAFQARDLASLVLNAVYPIGSVYMSLNSVNPGDLFGGSWEQIQDCFLLASGNIYEAGSTGGEASHTLTVDELPSHNHSASANTTGAHTHQIGTDKDIDYLANGDCWSVHNGASGASYMNGSTSSTGSHTHTITVENQGGGTAHNNMPPYMAVYVWKRVS